MTYTYVHHSGRFDRTADNLVKAFNHDRALGADVVAYTEVDAEGRFDALSAAADEAGWGVYRPGESADDVAFLWDKEKFTFIKGWGKILSDYKTYSTKGTLLKPFAGTFVILRENGSGKRRGKGALHTPSHVDVGTKGWRRVAGKLTRRVRQYMLGMPVANREMRKMITQYHVDARTLSADFNLNLNNKWVQRYLKSTFPAFRLATDKQNAGTHGNRRIDGVLLGGAVKQKGDVTVYSTMDSDHKAVLVELD